MANFNPYQFTNSHYPPDYSQYGNGLFSPFSSQMFSQDSQPSTSQPSFDRAFEHGQPIDDTPSLACFFFKVVKYQLRLNVRLPWYEFESSDCRDKTVRHLLCWRQVALKIMVNLTVSYENSSENSERILKITIFICVLDLKPASLISPVRNEVWYDFYFHSGKKDSVVSRGGKGSHLDCQRIAWRRSQHRNNEQGMRAVRRPSATVHFED